MHNSTTYKEPFWAENSGFITGRDALGLQNSSITVYSKLLPGLTNLTQRLRYYGFYCWLLKEYDKNSLNSNNRTIEGQYNFVRRAELIIAYLMVNTAPNQLSVIGSDYARKHLSEVEELGFYNLESGADKIKSTTKGSVYWDFISGALGQYYAGSLAALKLIKISEKFFELNKDQGLKLADAFEKSIEEPARNLFLNAIEIGKLTKSDIENLQSFALHKIQVYTEEWHCYKDILLGADGVNNQTIENKLTYNRKETIKLFLEYTNENPIHLDFVSYQYSLCEEKLENCDANFGWYYYYINESFHYSIETIFWVFLSELEGNAVPIQEFINQISDLAIVQLNTKFNCEPNQTLELLLSELPQENLLDVLKNLEELTRSKSNTHDAIGLAFMVLFQTYKISDLRSSDISTFENLYRITEQNGHVSENAKKYIANYLYWELKSYINEVIKIILNNHISTAYRKMGNGESNLLKFMIEDNLIMHIQTMSPNHTTPRIHTLNNFMVDMKLMTSDKKLTLNGIELLKTI